MDLENPVNIGYYVEDKEKWGVPYKKLKYF
jgi:hypothetical protein